MKLPSGVKVVRVRHGAGGIVVTLTLDGRPGTTTEHPVAGDDVGLVLRALDAAAKDSV